MRRIIVGLIIAAAPGCFHVGAKWAVSVSGTVARPEGSADNACALEMYRAQGDELVKERRVGTAFEEVFMISPVRGQYYFMVRCADGLSSERTERFEVKGMERYEDAIQLGELAVR